MPREERLDQHNLRIIIEAQAPNKVGVWVGDPWEMPPVVFLRNLRTKFADAGHIANWHTL